MELRNKISDTTKIASVSIIPGLHGLVELYGADLPFVVVQSTGNRERDHLLEHIPYDLTTGTFLSDNHERVRYDPVDDRFETLSGETIHPKVNALYMKIHAATLAGKILYVAGYDVNSNGDYVRNYSSTGCTDIENNCLYAPYSFEVPNYGYVRGTSYSAPTVASALASVLALYPDTTGVDLIKLAKTCAVPESTLPSGLGRADFGCMTIMDENGQWRAVTQGELNNLISPSQMRRMTFPGRTRVTGRFALISRNTPGKATIQLGYTSPGIFKYHSGVPVITDKSKTGLYPIMAGDTANHALGFGYASEDGMFTHVTHGRRTDFFGLNRAYGYTGGPAVDIDIGHHNAFARFSWRQSNGRFLVQEAEGTALGLTARKDISLSREMTLRIRANMDRFIGGSANTPFGKVSIGNSGWNKEVEASVSIILDEASSLSVSLANRWYSGEAGDARVTLDYRVRF